MGSLVKTSRGEYRHPMVMPEVSRLNHCGEMEVEDGTLKFEVILEDAKTKKIPRPKSAPSPMPNYEEIQQKLKAAEERRKQFESEQLAQLAEKEKRAEEVRAKKSSRGSLTQEEIEKEVLE